MKTVSRTLQLFIAVLVIVVGLSAASVRVLFPNADRYRGDLEIWLAGIAGQPVAIGSLQAEWRGWRPEFRINDLRLRDPTQRGKDGGVNAHFQSATVTVDVLASLLGGELRPRHVHIGDVSLRINAATQAVGPDAALQQHIPALLEWLLSRDRLSLDATRVEFSDLRVAGEPVTVTNLHLALRNYGPSHAFDVAVEIPGVRNGAVRAKATLTGNPASSDWSGDIAVHVDGLNLATLQAWRYRLGDTAASGRLSLSLDSRWQAGSLVGANGNLAVRDVRVTSASGTLGPLNAETLVSVDGDAGDWRVRLLHPGTGFLSLREPVPLASLHYTGAPSRARISVEMAALDIADLVPLLPIALQAPEDGWQQLLDAAPEGELRELAMTMERDADGIRDVSVAGAFHEVGITSIRGLPALRGVDGSFEHDASGTRVRLADGAVHAAIPDMFPAPITGRNLHGELSWSVHGSERRLVLSDVGFITPDVTARATGTLLWQADDDLPVVDLALGFSDGDLARIEYFIPTSMFGKRTGEWLDQAFPRGRLSEGSVELRGRPPRTLEAESDFSVTVRATVQDATVHYLDGWPSVERVTGTVHVADRRLVGSVSEGHFFDARLRPGRFVVADILAEDPVFEWDARIDGSSEDAMRFLRESPLRRSFRSLVDNVDASGPASLALDLRLPIASGIPTLEGSIDVTGNTLSVPSLREGFSDVSGRVRFDQDGMGGEGVSGNYLGRAVSAKIESVAERSGHTRVQLTGDADAAYVARHLHNAGLLGSPEAESMPILTRLEGSAPWQATIDVLERADSGEAPVVLRVESSLLGAAVALPAPFYKAAGTSMPLIVEARFADTEHRQMHLTLGSLASGIFDLRLDDGSYRLHRGAVRLGGEAASLPEQARISVSGRLQQAALSEWSAMVLAPGNGAPTEDALPTSVDLTIARLAMLGGEFAHVRIRADGEPAGNWRAAIAGPGVDGKLLIPADRLRQPVVADFERLVLTPIAGDDGDPVDPRKLPPLHFTCGSCTYGDTQLQDLEVITSRRSDGLSIDSLRVRTDGFQASADGAWTDDGSGNQRTRLDLRLGSDDLGKLLASLGHKGGATRGGATELTLAASWDGPPSKFHLGALDGVLHFRAGQGTLTDVSRGTTGRLLGLLVVPDLPRRLKGDFSDIFEDGFVYKQIEGTFNIERGNAYTNDLTLDGSMARIDIAGRTGLTDEDYDQLITVTPKVSASLPLMPIWLVEKAIQTQLFNKLFAYQYSVTGSWEDPSVTPIVIEKPFPSDRS